MLKQIECFGQMSGPISVTFACALCTYRYRTGAALEMDTEVAADIVQEQMPAINNR